MAQEAKQVAWRVREWEKAALIGHTKTNQLIASGELPSAKVGKRRLILESPSDFLNRHRAVPA